MSKRNHSWNENKYNRFVNEGRGQGVGKEYKPWLTIQDFPSMGRVSRILGWKSGRIHHLFSDLQARYFYMLEWEDTVTDIREHFPLLDLEDTVQQKSGNNDNQSIHQVQKKKTTIQDDKTSPQNKPTVEIVRLGDDAFE